MNNRNRVGADNPLFRGGKTHDGNGYVQLSSKVHGVNQWRREHQVVAEKMIGRPLRDGEIVHHKNGVKHDNRPENLSIETRASHNREHGNGQEIACAKCGKQKWYSAAGMARLSRAYQCRHCRYGKSWNTAVAK